MQKPPDPAHDEAQRMFRRAMSHLGAAVNIVTTAGTAGRCGITASAVCSVTDSPPTVLVCINRSSAAHDVFEQNGAIGINVLPAHHESLARHFAGMTGVPMAERFDLPGWREGFDGVPVLDDALASVQGRVREMKTVGSHSVIFIEVTRIDVSDAGDSLIYFDRQFCSVPRAVRQG